MIAWILAAVVGGLTVHCVVNGRLLPRPDPRPSPVDGAVSVLLPVREEAHRVGACLESLLRQRGVPGLEILVLDDGSTDGTGDVVTAVAAAHPNGAIVRKLAGAPLPAGWLGKPWACHQLAGRSTSDILMFVDADVVLAPDAVAAAVGLLHGYDLISPYPRILTGGSGQWLVQPLLSWSWLTFLPIRAMQRSPRPSLAAAGGQFLVVTRSGYERAGGHAAVRDAVLEDIELARAVKRTGGRITLADGSRLAACRMYSSWSGLVDGYTKSLWASFGSPVAAAVVVGILVLLYAVPLPLAVLAAALGAWNWAAAGAAGYLLGVAGRIAAARATASRAWPDALAHPVSIGLFAWLVARSYRRRDTVTWKGRSVRIR